MPFQTSVNLTQAPATEGDIADLNPRRILPGASGSWVAGVGGITIGRFAWADFAVSDSVLVNNGAGVPACIVAREMGDALNTGYLQEAGMVIPAGFQVGAPVIGGDVWVKNTGAGAVTVGMKAYASTTTGQVQFAATGGTVAGYVETKWYAATPGAAGELIKITDIVLD